MTFTSRKYGDRYYIWPTTWRWPPLQIVAQSYESRSDADAAATRAAQIKIVRGAYHHTADDRLDRWYLDDTQSRTVDRRGAGYRTRREAIEWLLTFDWSRR